VIIDFIRLQLILIDFNRQVSEIQKTMYGIGIRRLWTGTTVTGARRSKGHTNPANTAHLAEREESRSSLYFSNVELNKNTDEIKCQFTLRYFLITLLASIFSRI